MDNRAVGGPGRYVGVRYCHRRVLETETERRQTVGPLQW